MKKWEYLYCCARCAIFAALIKHARDVHENNFNFYPVLCGECDRSYSKWNSLKKHTDNQRKEVVCMSHKYNRYFLITS